MSETKPPTSDPSMLNFYAVGGRPVVVDGISHESWVWQGGSWTGDLRLADICFRKGLPLSQYDFVDRYPEAAQVLLNGAKS